MNRRIVIFKDRYHNTLHPRKFYRDFPHIHTCEQKHYFSFGYMYGQCERIEFIDTDCYVIAEITILNVSGSNAYD